MHVQNNEKWVIFQHKLNIVHGWRQPCKRREEREKELERNFKRKNEEDRRLEEQRQKKRILEEEEERDLFLRKKNV